MQKLTLLKVKIICLTNEDEVLNLYHCHCKSFTLCLDGLKSRTTVELSKVGQPVLVKCEILLGD